ncbi:MAG: glycosyltransferase [Calothrix sp. MO_167.B12]|nr:glycosyltransferase [Calothrix sp. MO_167.B12]
MNVVPEISVIIPVYNGEKTIKETIESVLKQSFSNIEVIIINDGSTDSTLKIINSIDDIRLQVFSYPNAGSGASRNRGIEKANGNYISFIDADDLWVPDKLEAQYQALQNNPQATIAYSWTDYIDELGNIIKSGGRKKCHGYVYQDMLVSNFLENGSNFLTHSKVFQDVGHFDESLSASEDWDMLLRLSQRYQFVCVDKPQILYRISVKSRSANLIKQELASLGLINKFFNHCESIPFQHLKSLSISVLYKYLFFKAIDISIQQSYICIATKYFWNWIIHNPLVIFRETRLIIIAILKIIALWTYYPIMLFKGFFAY